MILAGIVSDYEIYTAIGVFAGMCFIPPLTYLFVLWAKHRPQRVSIHLIVWPLLAWIIVGPLLGFIAICIWEADGIDHWLSSRTGSASCKNAMTLIAMLCLHRTC